MSHPPSTESNNPFCHSIIASDSDNLAATSTNSTPSRSLCPTSHPLQKSPSTTTTIMEEDEDDVTCTSTTGQTGTNPTSTMTLSCSNPSSTPLPASQLPDLPTTAALAATVVAAAAVGPPQPPPGALILDGQKHKASLGSTRGDGHILITIQSRDSQASTPPQTAVQAKSRMSLDASYQQNECGNMWIPLRFVQKAKNKSRRRWIIIKVFIALVIVIGGVAVGLGITKAVSDGKN